jgi:hypothetical protein
VTIRISVDDLKTRAYLTSEAGPVVRFVRRTARDVRTRAVLYCPVDTGTLRNSIREHVDISQRRIVAYVGSDVEYARYVHDGTRPHLIRPRRPGGVLRFTVGTEVVFTTLVRHPGTRAQPFLRRAVQEVAVPRGFVFRR